MKDLIGRNLEVGQFVILAHGGKNGGAGVYIAKVLDFTPKRVRVQELGKTNWQGELSTSLKHPGDLVIIPHDEDLTMYLLKHNLK